MIVQKGSRYFLKLYTPKRFQVVDHRRQVWLSLGTDSRKTAEALAPVAKARQEALWSEAVGEAIPDRAARVMALAASMGREYRSADILASGPLSEIISRTRAIPVDAAPNSIIVDALLGGVQQPKVKVSALLKKEVEFRESELRGKNADQMRVWRGARHRALTLFIEAVGDLDLDQITRAHGRAFRRSLEARVATGGIKTETANKAIALVGAMFNHVSREIDLDHNNPFSGVKLTVPKRRDKTRKPIPDSLIRSIILNDEKMRALNNEARDILLITLNTGARPSEIIGLMPSAIHLETQIPWITIEEDGREVKSEASLRDIPLVGVALEAMRRNPDGFPRYRGRPTSWSNAVNKHLRAAGLPKELSAYGLRHAFQDRITRARLTAREDHDLMGHALDREKYGEGLTLKEKRDALLKISYL